MGQPIKGQISMDDVLRFQARRIVTNLFKSFLVAMEDLAQDHDEALGKLATELPPELRGYVKLADYLTEERAERLRSKILDAGNDAVRQLEEQLANYDVVLKNPHQ